MQELCGILGYLIVLAGGFGCQVTASREATLSNKNLVVAAEPWPPFLYMKVDKNGREVYTGMIWDLMEFVKEARNCTYQIVRSTDGLWGNCHGNDNCTGMIGQVNRKEVDFAIGLIYPHIYKE